MKLEHREMELLKVILLHLLQHKNKDRLFWFLIKCSFLCLPVHTAYHTSSEEFMVWFIEHWFWVSLLVTECEHHRFGSCGCTVSREPMNISLILIRWKPTPTLNFQMIHLLVSFPAKNAMSYSFWNVYRWELESVGGGQFDYYNHPKRVPNFLLSKNILTILLTFSVIWPWPFQLVVILISLFFPVHINYLWVTLIRHLASYIDILS